MKVKYITCISIVALSMLSIKNKAYATLKGNAAYTASLAMAGNGSSDYIIFNNNKVSNKFKNQASTLVSNKHIIGATSKNFDPSKISKMHNRNYYHQNTNGDGQIVTLVSTKRSKIVNIEGNKVTSEFLNTDGNKVTMVTEGIPNWILGMDIYVELKTKEKQQKAIQKSLNKESKSGILGKLKNLNLRGSYKLNEQDEDDLSHLGAAAPLNVSIDSINSGFINLIDETENKQRKNDYRGLVGSGLVNYGFDDNNLSDGYLGEDVLNKPLKTVSQSKYILQNKSKNQQNKESDSDSDKLID